MSDHEISTMPFVYTALLSLALNLATVQASFAADTPSAATTQANTALPPPARGPSLALALEAAQVAVSTCTANGYKTAVSVVDSAGVLKALLAADGASQRGVESSQAKAYTSITFKLPSGEVAKQVETDADLKARLAADPKQRARAGALPLYVSGELIGAIGVGGAPGSEKDEACAQAGLDKVKDRLK